MATIWVRKFSGGLDATRIPETSAGGTLLKGDDGHINRGGEFEKRAAFVPTYDLTGKMTTGLAATTAGLFVFGDVAAPVLPSGVAYQRLQHPDGSTALSRVVSTDLYGGKIYAVAEFADGGRYHFYDGVRVAEWFDGRARAALSIAGASGSALSTLTVNGVDILGGAVNWAVSDANTAVLIAAQINSCTSSPEYSATVNGNTVNIVATDPGIDSNGFAVSYTGTALTFTPTSGLFLAGGVDVTNAAPPTGSVDVVGGSSGSDQLTMLDIDGVDILGATVDWTTDNATTAGLIASQINNFTSTPDYSATASGATVTITAVNADNSVNGTAPVPTVAGALAIGNIQAMAGGVNAQAVYVPGTFVRTIGSRVMSVSGSSLFFSGIEQPTEFTTAGLGAGFLDMSKQAAEATVLQSIGVYYAFVAVFAERVILIYLIDADPTNNKLQQRLLNTGTASPRSVTQFGDSDLFYLDESGVRSIRARDASNAAATTDLGSPVDTLITAKLRALSPLERQNVIGLINPIDKRFWLIFPDQIFVFSFFEGTKISAWTTYNPFYFNDAGAKVLITIDDAAVFNRRVYIRGGDKVFCYGSVATGLATDDTSAVAWLPFLDGESPTVEKKWTGFDAAVRGVWNVRAGMQPTEAGLLIDDEIANISETTFTKPDLAEVGQSTHISMRFASSGPGPAILSSCAIHYEGEKVSES